MNAQAPRHGGDSYSIAVDLQAEARREAATTLEAKLGKDKYAKISAKFEQSLKEESTKAAQQSASIRYVHLRFVDVSTAGITSKFTSFKPCVGKSVILELTGVVVANYTSVMQLADETIVRTAANLAFQAVYSAPPSGADASAVGEAATTYSSSVKRKINIKSDVTSPRFYPYWYMPDLVSDPK